MPRRTASYTCRAGTNLVAADQVVCFNTLHSALLAVGLTQTADTGQVGTITGNVGNTAPTLLGYRVYKMTDSLGDLYIKVQFYSAYATLPGIYVTVGFSTDGAGNIDGVAASAGNVFNAWGALSVSGAYMEASAELNVIKGDGFLYIGLGDDAVKVMPTAVESTRVSLASIGVDGGLGWVALGRQTDAAGVLLSDRVVIVGGGHVSGHSTTAGNLGFAYNLQSLYTYLRSKMVGQAARVSVLPVAIVCPETASQRSGNAVVARVYADYPDTGPLPIRWIGAMPAQNAAKHDTIEIALVGSTVKTYRHVNPGGYPAFTPFVTSSELGTGRYLSPLIEDDGTTV